MSIKIATSFDVGSNVPVDDRLVMNSTELKNVNDNTMPDSYLCVCPDLDGKIFIYNKAFELDPEFGRFRPFETSAELALDSAPTKDSKNYVNSGVVYGSLFETKQRTVIDTPENYVACASSDEGALEVVDDSTTSTSTQVALSIVQAFVPTAQVGEYYQHIDEVSHLEDYEDTIYAPRDEVYDKTDIDEKVQDINDAINNIISGGYEPMSVAEFTNFYDGLAITATQI